MHSRLPQRLASAQPVRNHRRGALLEKKFRITKYDSDPQLWQLGARRSRRLEALTEWYAENSSRWCSAERQSQRDCILQPRVARNELPWESVRKRFQPQPR